MAHKQLNASRIEMQNDLPFIFLVLFLPIFLFAVSRRIKLFYLLLKLINLVNDINCSGAELYVNVMVISNFFKDSGAEIVF